MALVPHNTNYIIRFWVPLPAPLGIPSGSELSVESAALFPASAPGFLVPDHPDGPRYLSQSWRVFQKTKTPSSPVLEFAAELFDDRISISGDSRDQNSSRLDLETMMTELGMQWHTVVEAMCPIESPEKEHVVAKLNEVITALSNVQVRLNQIHGISSHLFTPPAFDPVPYSVSSSEGEIVHGMTTPGNFTKLSHSIDIPLATPLELQQSLRPALGESEPFRSAAVLDMEADSARLTGANILAAICYGAATEARLIELGMFLSWEAEQDTSEVAKKIPTRGTVHGGFLQHLGDHLHGSWDKRSSEPLRNWDQNIVQVRNNAAHGGYEPTVHEIERANEAMLGLREFIRERLLARATVYPFVADYYLGSAALQASERFTNWQDTMSNYQLTPYPEASFTRYKTEIRSRNLRSTDELVGGTIIEITDAQGQLNVVELDEQSLLCRYISLPERADYRELQRIVGKADEVVTTERLIEIEDVDFKPTSEWFPSSSVIPSYSTRRSDIWEAIDYQVHPHTS